MDNIPTADEILNVLIPYKTNVSNEENEDSKKQNIECLKEWAKLHVEAALKVASEKAIAPNITWGNGAIVKNIKIDKNSILNAYPLENIK